ncbi:MAG TPA: hypothetical protein VIV40_15455 [Kofleriaceae bacterium]
MLRSSLGLAAFVTCVLCVVIACRHSSPEPKRAPVAEPAPSRRAPPPEATVPAQPAAAPAPPTPVVKQPVAQSTVEPSCPPKVQPKGCPATQPNVNHPCSPKGMECTYAAGCCPPVFACNKTGHFEARFTRCN